MSKDEHERLLRLFSRAGLSIDHPLFDDAVLEKATAAILRTRDGSLRLATPGPLGQCTFVNEFTIKNLQRILEVHKKFVHNYPRQGAGIEAYVDASDTGETKQNKDEIKDEIKAFAEAGIKQVDGGELKTELENGHTNGLSNGHTNGTSNGVANGVNGHHPNGAATNGHTNGVH